jgi:flagellar basal body-associated protein FliL
MSLIAIVLSVVLFAAIVGVAYWFASEEQKQKMSKPEPEMDEETRQKQRESAASIIDIGMP